MSEPRIIVIAHGKSEIELVKWIGSRLKMGIVIDSNNNGNETIRIENLHEWLSQKHYSSISQLHKKFKNLEYEHGSTDPMPRLRIFIIMDTEDSNSAKSFITGDMFSNIILRDKIVPIYNHPNMDELFLRVGIGNVSRDKPRSYLDFFDEMEPNDLYERIKDDKGTNLDDFILYCLNTRPSNQGKIK